MTFFDGYTSDWELMIARENKEIAQRHLAQWGVLSKPKKQLSEQKLAEDTTPWPRYDIGWEQPVLTPQTTEEQFITNYHNKDGTQLTEAQKEWMNDIITRGKTLEID